MKDILYKISFILLPIIFFALLLTAKVSAAYKYCDYKIPGTEYYDCGNYIYTYYEDAGISSIIYAKDKNASIIYAGEENGTSIFFASGLRFYNRSYDDTSKEDNDLWTIVSMRGKEVFNGSFIDSWLLDDSHEDYYYFSLTREVYAFRQYSKNQGVYRTIAIYNVDKNSIDINSVEYDGLSLHEYSQNVVDAKDGIKASVSAKYGSKYVTATLFDKEVNCEFDGINIHISPEEINAVMENGKEGNLIITAYNYFGGSIQKKYRLKSVNDSVIINFSTMSSIIESNSRRILISADPGKGKTLDTDYCWYYWSTSGDDSLVYDEFLKNYANSSNKGSYSEGKGVILRNTTGTYYLYALAKDDDSWVVEKSEGYILNNIHPTPTYDLGDMILLVSLAILAVVPVVIYLFVRKKGY